eukprot:CAMPEP_0184692804 /NCGR_PEP_ID=MMETSP0313-20130426/1115_1 /TAXON_ID=2792 /ORGANISM="Porphyridium aerugineum, Strain SAG 1380-2" /LENGTH=246 /DNA_ID=CAMNT_0027150655 /DNA_START=110 /DNA_END=850 /DNA_ORIENTATION=+
MSERVQLLPTGVLEGDQEKHFSGGALVQDITLGMSDGLTVPFALAAGLAGALESSRFVVLACVAELVAGSMSMGLGGWLSGRTEVEHYQKERKVEEWEVIHKVDAEIRETMDILEEFGLDHKQASLIVENFRKPENHDKWVDFMMRFELDLTEPDPQQAIKSALAIGMSYCFGGLIPLIPYVFIPVAKTALIYSVFVTVLALFVFGLAKGHLCGHNKWSSAFETTFVGIAAAASAYFIAQLVRIEP